jgi:glutamate 5-kinase
MRGKTMIKLEGINTAGLRQSVVRARTVVVKVGTKVLVRDDGNVAIEVLNDIARSIVNLSAMGRKVLLVSSGAVGIGAACLDLSPELVSVCAAAGQIVLTALYHNAFTRLGIATAQILVTDDDFQQDDRHTKLGDTLRHLIDLSVVPIINENDVVTHLPDKDPNTRIFSDNDMLASLIAGTVGADLLVVLTDVDGVYTHYPGDENSLLIPHVAGDLRGVISAQRINRNGRGGMQAKLRATTQAARNNGLIAVIANGRTPDVLNLIMKGLPIGTLVAGEEER